MKTTQEVANRLVELCRVGDYDRVYDELFHEEVVAIEPETARVPGKTVGIAAIKAKGAEFNNMIEEMHGGFVSDPLVAGDFITLTMGFEATFKERGRVKEDEVVVYQVKDGKIISEQYFY